MAVPTSLPLLPITSLARGPARSVGRSAILFLALTFLAGFTKSGGAFVPTSQLTELRALYHSAVMDEAAIERGRELVEEIRDQSIPSPGSSLEATLAAYEGALITLRAKHALWPPIKLRHLREGLALLDAVVLTHPHHFEARYLRLMTCYHLPPILGRTRSVGEDFEMLARLLPSANSDYPGDLLRGVAMFVLENGDLPAAERRHLIESLGSSRSQGRR